MALIDRINIENAQKDMKQKELTLAILLTVLDQNLRKNRPNALIHQNHSQHRRLERLAEGTVELMSHNACQAERHTGLGQQAHPQTQCFVLVHTNHVTTRSGAEEHAERAYQGGNDTKSEGINKHGEV